MVGNGDCEPQELEQSNPLQFNMEWAQPVQRKQIQSGICPCRTPQTGATRKSQCLEFTCGYKCRWNLTVALYTRVLEYMVTVFEVKAGLSHTHMLIQPVLIPSTSDIDVLSQLHASHPAPKVPSAVRKRSKGLMYLQCKAVSGRRPEQIS